MKFMGLNKESLKRFVFHFCGKNLVRYLFNIYPLALSHKLPLL